MFIEALDLDENVDVANLEYRDIEAWDSIGHMALITAIEDEFDMQFDTDQVIDMSSFKDAAASIEGGVVEGKALDVTDAKVASAVEIPAGMWSGADASAGSGLMPALPMPSYDMSDSASYGQGVSEDLVSELEAAWSRLDDAHD